MATPKVRTFREDRSIVVDVSHDGAKPKAAEQDAKPKQVAKPKQAAAVPPACACAALCIRHRAA